MQTPYLPPPSEWSPQADPPLERNYRRPENHYALQQAANNVSHVRSYSATCAQGSAWISPPNVGLNTVNLVPQHGETRMMRPNSFYQPFGTGFSFAALCPPVSNTRSTLATNIQPSSHMRTYSQSASGKENCCLFPASCSHLSGHLPSFAHAQADPLQFRPLWLRA